MNGESVRLNDQAKLKKAIIFFYRNIQQYMDASIIVFLIQTKYILINDKYLCIMDNR